MPLSKEQVERINAAAQAAGIPAADVLREAERISGGNGANTTAAQTADVPTEAPALVAERFLIGFMPYVTVREFRTKVLGLTNTVPDENLFTGEWLDIHGQATPASTGDDTSADNSEGRAEPPSQKGE